ncbi:MAG: DUF4221 family protein [Flavobacteriales bacterium]
MACLSIGKRGARIGAPLFPSFSIPILSLLLLACTPTHEKDEDRVRTEKKGIRSFDLSKNSYDAKNLDLHQDYHKLYLINNNHSAYDKVNELELYTFREQKLVTRIELLPDSVPFRRVHDILYLNHDSIFFTRPGKNSFYHTLFVRMDRSGSIRSQWTFDGTDTEHPYAFWIGGGRLFAPLAYEKGHFYSPVFPAREQLDTSVYGIEHMARISLKEGNAPQVELFASYPPIYAKADRHYLKERELQRIPPLGTFDHAIADSSIVISYPLVDTLYRYNLNGRLVMKKAAKSRYASPQHFWDELEQQGSELFKKKYPDKCQELSHYFSIIHDPFRELYYRTVNLDGKHASLMILGKELQVLKELRFEKKAAPHPLPFHAPPILSKKGLYIPLKNRKSLRFRILRIERLQAS